MKKFWKNIFESNKQEVSPQDKKMICGVCEKEKKNKFCKNCKEKTKSIHCVTLTETIKATDSLGINIKRSDKSVDHFFWSFLFFRWLASDNHFLL